MLSDHLTQQHTEYEYQLLQIIDQSIDGIVLFDNAGKVMEWNKSQENISGIPRSEALGQFLWEVMNRMRPGTQPPSKETIFSMMAMGPILSTGEIPASYQSIEQAIPTGNGDIRFLLYRFFTIQSHGQKILGFFSRDNTRIHFEQEERDVTLAILEIINRQDDIRALIKQILAYLQGWLGCDAIGIRLKDKLDYPYYETSGFEQSFVEKERHLCAVNRHGAVIMDRRGDPVLECMCGNVIRGRTDPSKPFFTQHGSFFSNHTTRLLATTTEKDRMARTRNRCNGEGYETVTLIPLKKGEERIGLLQINDRRINFLSRDRVTILEHLANHIVIGLSQQIANAELHTSLKEKDILMREIHHRVKITSR